MHIKNKKNNTHTRLCLYIRIRLCTNKIYVHMLCTYKYENIKKNKASGPIKKSGTIVT